MEKPILDIRKAPPSPDQLTSADSGLPSLDVAKATSPSVKPLSARADLPWERAILHKSSILYLMVGYPGAGKTTTSKIICRLTGAVHLWADQTRNKLYPNPTHSHQENIDLYNFLNKQTEQLLAKGKSVVFDTGFNFYEDRQLLKSIADKYGAKTIILWLKTDKKLSQNRATHHLHAINNTYPWSMTTEQFDRISNSLQIPNSDENYIELDGTKISEQYIKNILNI